MYEITESEAAQISGGFAWTLIGAGAVALGFVARRAGATALGTRLGRAGAVLTGASLFNTFSDELNEAKDNTEREAKPDGDVPPPKAEPKQPQ